MRGTIIVSPMVLCREVEAARVHFVSGRRPRTLSSIVRLRAAAASCASPQAQPWIHGARLMRRKRSSATRRPRVQARRCSWSRAPRTQPGSRSEWVLATWFCLWPGMLAIPWHNRGHTMTLATRAATLGAVLNLLAQAGGSLSQPNTCLVTLRRHLVYRARRLCWACTRRGIRARTLGIACAGVTPRFGVVSTRRGRATCAHLTSLGFVFSRARAMS